MSILWKREHPWVHSGVLPMEKGAPMGSKWQTFVGAPMVAPSCCPSHGREHPWVHAVSFQWKRMHPWVPRGKHWLEHQWWLHAGVHPMEEGAPMGPKG